MSSDHFYEFTDLFKQLYEVKGSKIVLKVREGDYEGVLKHVLPQSKRLVMNHVYFLPKREYMGTLNFFFREISSFSVLETAEEMEIGKPVKWDYISRILDGVSFGHTYSITDLFEELDEKTESDEDVPYPEDLEIDDFVLDLPSDLRIKLPQDNVIIDAVDSNFNLAIKHISQQKTIGVAFDGPKISRLGKLSWVCISSPCCLFLFDIHVLGKAAFDHGLRHIFQNKNIEKVIHDCREPSDCLFHLFDTKMVNVFDTQVADYVVNTQRCVDKHAFKYVSSLDGCLVHYLNVPATYLHNREKYFSAEDEDIFYRVRPVSNDYRDVLIKNAVYLCLLKEELLELMLSPFRKSVDVYLNVLANASESELLLDISVPEKIPPALVMQGLQTVRFAEPKEFSVVPLVRNFIDLQKGTIVDMSSVTCVDAVKKDLDIDKQLSNEICSKKYNTKLSKTEFQNTQNTQKKRCNC